jgi:alpha-D-ribose 1-methylphosphonate 5-triphosphate diphosphatase
MSTARSELVLTNAAIVTRDDCFRGSVVIADGKIAAIDPAPAAAPGAVDLEGDYLIPGLVELHTDGMERHFAPRPGVNWPRQGAMLAHDAQMASWGVTTVLDAVALGDINEKSPRVTLLRDMCEAVRAITDGGLARAEHFLHLRCELTFEHVVENFAEFSRDSRVRLASLMDHTPGQRQFVDIDKYRVYYQGKYHLSSTEIDRFMERQRAAHERFAAQHRRSILEICHARGLALASHDDATTEHVAEAAASGMVIAEFPTTFAAAEAAHAHGLKILMGGPNIVLGGSHSGNISAAALAERGLLDVVASDYVPSSLLQSAFVLADGDFGLTLADAVAMVSATPAHLVGLDDRGEIALGRRADPVRVKATPAGPVTRAVWREGARIA